MFYLFISVQEVLWKDSATETWAEEFGKRWYHLFPFLLAQIQFLGVFDRSQCVWFPVFNLHRSRIPEPGRSGRGARESGAECNAGVGPRSCRSQEYPSVAGEAVSARPSAFLLLRIICNSVWRRYKPWVFSCVSLSLNRSDSSSPPPFHFTVPFLELEFFGIFARISAV